MSERKSPIMPLAIALILFAVVAAIAWMLIQPTSNAAKITLPILNKEFSQFTVLGILMGVAAALTGGAGIIMRILFGMIDKTIGRVKTNKEYTTSLAETGNRQKALIKEYRQLQPPDPIPSHDRPGWTVISTALLMGLMFAFFGAAFSANFTDGSNLGSYSAWFAVTGIVLGFLGLNTTRVQQIKKDEGKPVSGNALWVIISGFSILVFGIGIMMWIRTQGG